MAPQLRIFRREAASAPTLSHRRFNQLRWFVLFADSFVSRLHAQGIGWCGSNT
jgi:hypothetical protein